MPNKKNFNNLILVVAAGIALAVGVAGSVYYYGQNREASLALQGKRAKLERLEAQLRALPDLEAESAGLLAEEKKFAAFIPSREGQAQFIKELDRIAAGSRVKLKDCQSKTETVTLKNLPSYTIYQWEITVTSDYGALLDFLTSLGEASRFLMVSKVATVSNWGDEAAADQLQVKLTLDLITRAGPEKVSS